VTLYSVRVLDCNGSGSTSGVIAGVDWVTANRQLPAVANMSVGGGLSSSLNSAVEKAISAGVVFAVAAGNNASDACSYSPSSATNALTVAATQSNDYQASYSNFGSCVDLYAPGSGIYSSWNTDDYSMGSASGTSMATPHVAGAAALYLESNPTATPADVANAILSSATSNALLGVTAGTVNRLLRTNGSGSGTITNPTPTPTPTPAPPPSTNAAPTASFTASCASNKNNCSFDASSSKDDTGITSYSWSFGDGTSAVTAANPGASHTYNSKGSYTVSLTVTDGAGLSASAQLTVSIKSLSR
jgi:Subtilisin-like serine proteases